MTKLPEAFSIRELIAEVSARARLYGLSLFLCLAIVASSITLHHQQELACHLVLSKLDALRGPMGRELALGDSHAAGEMVRELGQALSGLKIQNELKLRASMETVNRDLGATCRAGVFSAEVAYPVLFADQSHGVVRGKISDGYWTHLGLLLLFTFFAITYGLKALSSRISARLKSAILEPIQALISGDSDGLDASNFATEVTEIKNQILQMKLKLLEQERENAALIRAQELSAFASQVAHDLRSPLAGLTLAVEDVTSLIPEKSRVLLRSALSRTRDIASSLSIKSTEYLKQPDARIELTESTEPAESNAESFKVHLLAGLVDSLLSEKRAEYRLYEEIEIRGDLTPSAYGLFARLHSGALKRVLSNLINNSVESIQGKGSISLRLSKAEEWAEIEITDTGCGIAPDRMTEIFKQGVSFGKTAGLGLGLFHAKDQIESLGGKISIRSVLGAGTQVVLTLPLHSPPSWFAESLSLFGINRVVVLDDDPSIHELWRYRLKNLDLDDPITEDHFERGADFERWMLSHCGRPERTVYLIDYELLGENETGLDWIERLELRSSAYLITSRFEEEHLIRRCEQLGVKLIPKNLAGWVPIELKRTGSASSSLPCVLIDDEELTHVGWQLVADRTGRTLLSFRSADAAALALKTLPREVEIYIDSNLGAGARGEWIAKDFYEQGYRELYLCSGYSPKKFEAMPWLKGVIGKAPPWA